MENIDYAGLADVVRPIKKLSSQAVQDVPSPIAALFIDGDHSYESVKQDINNYYPKISDGGYLAFHDYGRFGVTKAVDEFLKSNNNFEFVCDCHSIRLLKKVVKA